MTALVLVIPFALLCAFAGRPAAAAPREREARPGLAPLSFQVSAGALLGLDRPLRGAEFAAGLALAGEALQPGIRARLGYDAGLGPCIVGADAALGFGDEIRLEVGGDLPLGPLRVSGGGATRRLAPLAWPNRFAVAAALADLAGGSEGAPRRGPRLRLEASLSWCAYSLRDADGEDVEAILDSGISGFAVGFKAALGIALEFP